MERLLKWCSTVIRKIQRYIKSRVMEGLTKKELLEEIYKNVRWNGDVLAKMYESSPKTKDGGDSDLIGDRPPKRP